MGTERKKYTNEQILEAIKNSTPDYQSIANYLAVNFDKKHQCSKDTAKALIERRNLECFMYQEMNEVTKKAWDSVKKNIEKGDTRDAKWWLERILRNQFGNEITVHNDNKEPLNINFENFSKTDLLDKDTEIGGSDEESGEEL